MNHSPVNVREYADDDRESVVALLNSVFPDSSGHNDPNQSIDRKTAHQDRLFLVAEQDSQVVGTVMAGYDGHRGWLYSLAVDPSHRRQGIGTLLVRHAEQRLITLGCPKLNLQVRKENDAVVAFYASIGFVMEDRISLGKRF